MSKVGLLPSDYVIAANNLGIEYLTVTSDEMFKRSFVMSDHPDLNARKCLLIRTVADLIERLDGGQGMSKTFENSSLGERSITKVTMIQETVFSKPLGLLGDKAKKSKKIKKAGEEVEEDPAQNLTKQQTKLPTLPKVDFAGLVTFDNKENCIFGIELQVENSHDSSIHVRLEDYGDRLSRLRLSIDGGKFEVRKVYETGLCMWDSDKSDALGVAWAPPRLCFTSTSSQGKNGPVYPDVIAKGLGCVPVCCAQLFLGKLVICTAEIIKYLQGVEEGKLISKDDQVEAINRAKQEGRQRLKGKFGSLEYNIDQLYEYFRSVAMSIPSEGFTETNFDANPELKEAFRKLEEYELLEFFSVGNSMRQSDVDNLISKTVKGLYMSTKIDENNIAYDQRQAREIWLADHYIAAKNEAKAAKNEAKVTGIVASRLIKGRLFWHEFKEVTGNDTQLGEHVIESLKKNNSDIEVYEGLDQDGRSQIKFIGVLNRDVERLSTAQGNQELRPLPPQGYPEYYPTQE
jgi:hypothetical protein